MYYTADGDLKSSLKNPDQTYRDKLEQDLNTVSTISKLTESVSIPHQVCIDAIDILSVQPRTQGILPPKSAKMPLATAGHPEFWGVWYDNLYWGN